jgi:predicted amidophosphoribosyltransferase
MHWKKNRLVSKLPKEQIIQHGACPGCGKPVKFYYGEGGQLCRTCKREKRRKASELE